MQELNYDQNSKLLNHKDEVISFKCELQENLQKAMKEFVEEHPNWGPIQDITSCYCRIFDAKRISK